MHPSRPCFKLPPLALAVALAFSAPGAVLAQAATDGLNTTTSLSIAAQPLGSALNALSAATGTPIGFSPALVSGKTAEGIQGSLTVRQAVDRLLAGSGLTAEQEGNGFVIRAASNAGDVTTLGAITISGKAPGSLTEGTGSYTTRSTSSATRLNLSQRETPQSITVMTQQRIEDQRLNDIESVLEATPGVFVAHHAGYGTETPVFSARGTSLNSFQIDGVQSSSSLQAYLQNTAIYDRIEVVRGATGLMNSLGTPAATVNMIRKRPTYDPQIKFSAEAGNWDRYGGGLDVSGPLTESGNVRGRVVFDYKNQGNWTDHYKQEYYTLYGIGELDLGDNTLLSLGFSHTTRNTEAPSTASPLFYSNGQQIPISHSDADKPSWTYYDHELNNVFASVEHQFSSGWSGKAEVNYSEHKSSSLYGGLNAASVSPDGGTNVRNLLHYKPTNKEATFDAYLTGPFSLFGREHEFIGGITISDLQRQAPSYSVRYSGGDGSYYVPDFFDLPNTLPRPDQITETGRGDTDETQYSAYMSARFRLGDATSFLLGGRVTEWERKTNSLTYATGASTKREQKETVFVPYAGIVHDLNDTWSVYASYTKIFNPHQDRFRDVNNSPLNPEEGTGYETGVKASFYEGRLNASLSLYKTDLDNKAIWSLVDGRTVYDTVDGAKTQGVELEVNGELAEGWQVGAGYSYNKTKDQNGDRINLFAPQHMVKAFSTYRLPGDLNKVTVGGGLTWMSRRESDITMGSYALASLMARYDVSKDMSVSLNVNNLFDKKYLAYVSNKAGAYGPPRNFMVSLRYAY